MVLHGYSLINGICIKGPVEPVLRQRQRRWIQTYALDLSGTHTRTQRIVRPQITLAVRYLIDDLDVLHRDVGEARCIESEPSARFDVELAFLTDLDIRIRIARRWIVLGTDAELALQQVIADDARTNCIDCVVIGAISDAIATRCRYREPQRAAIAQRDFADDVGAERQVVVRVHIRVLYHVESEASCSARTDHPDVTLIDAGCRRDSHR